MKKIIILLITIVVASIAAGASLMAAKVLTNTSMPTRIPVTTERVP